MWANYFWRGWCSVGLAGAALCAQGAPALSTEQYCSRPMRAAYFEFGVLYRSSSSDGIDARLLDTISQHTGCQFVNVVLPRNRIWSELQGGTLDVATAAIPTPERKVYGYMLPYLKTRNVVLLNRAAAPETMTMVQFEAGTLRLGVVRGFRHEEAYDSLIARLRDKGRVVEAADVAEDIRLLERGIVAAILGQPIVYRAYLKDEEINEKLVLHDWAPPDQFSVGGLILARKSFTPEQARHWDALLVKLLRDGTLLKINREFLPATQARDLLYTGPRSPD